MEIGNQYLSITSIQQASLKVLVEIDEICRNQKLRYSLAYGTLIGAVRHKGFIPWDDDIDIFMPRTDYEQLKAFFQDGYQGKLKWCDRTTIKNYPFCISRVSDLTYKYTTTRKNEKPYDIGVFVDIYPLDNYCNTDKEALKLGRRVWLKNRLFDIYLNPNKTRGLSKTIIRNILSLFLRLAHGSDWNKSIDAEIKRIIDNNTNDSNQIVGVISQVEWKELMKKEWFSNYEEVEFEHRLFMGCSGYRELLTNIYGNYMELPPVEKRVPTHDYTISLRKK